MTLFDEAVELVDGYLRGEGAAAVGPQPAQHSRPPIWVGGMRPGALRRAARWDGWIAMAVTEDGSTMNLSPAGLADMVGRLRGELASAGRAEAPFDVAVFGLSEPSGTDDVAAFGAAGATWWLESLSPLRGSLDELLARVDAGPPAP